MVEGDAVMARIHEGLQRHIGGDRAGARDLLARLWDEMGPEGDPLHRCALAQYMADVQYTAREELEWDLRALAAADSLTEERAREYHASIAVRGFYPSPHLNLGEDYRVLGDLERATEQLGLAEASLDALGDEGGSPRLREAAAGLAGRLAAAP
jgi:hypothetical protein